MTPSQTYLSVTEVAQRLGLHPESVRKMARANRLPAFKAGRSWRFDPEDLAAWLKASPTHGARSADSNPTHGARSENTRPSHSTREIRDADVGGCSVLIVDDEEPVCRTLARLLERFGCRSRQATRGEQGLALIAEQVPDLVLLDLVMPEMNGAQFLARLRDDHPDLPVIIVTGYPESELVFQAMQHAPVMLLAKPVDAPLLERTVRTALGGRLPAAAGP
jgi:excisionase family DNA binding protein